MRNCLIEQWCGALVRNPADFPDAGALLPGKNERHHDMKAWTIAAAAAAGLMSLTLLSAPASADGRGHHWGGNSYNSYNSYSRHNDCNDRRHYSGGRHRGHHDYGNNHRGGQRFGWNDRRWDNDWRDGDRHRGKHRSRHRDRDHDGDHDRRGRRDRRWN
jgi:hypothetical protein